MSIKGDMVASLCSSFGLSELDARAMVKNVIETARDPNFASRFACEEPRPDHTDMANEK
jgi:hypothetical protein